jgi:hypothetical protein
MATITAHILIGHTNQLGGGMLPTHCLLLSEGSKPVWILKDLDILEDHTSALSTVRWIPSDEHLLEDALLMISINILKDEKLLDKAKKYFKNLSDPLINLKEDINISALEELRAINRNLKYDFKVAISCFNGSSLGNKLDTLKEYCMDVEVCSSTYNRFYNPWIEKTVVNGNL